MDFETVEMLKTWSLVLVTFSGAIFFVLIVVIGAVSVKRMLSANKKLGGWTPPVDGGYHASEDHLALRKEFQEDMQLMHNLIQQKQTWEERAIKAEAGLAEMSKDPTPTPTKTVDCPNCRKETHLGEPVRSDIVDGDQSLIYICAHCEKEFSV